MNRPLRSCLLAPVVGGILVGTAACGRGATRDVEPGQVDTLPGAARNVVARTAGGALLATVSDPRQDSIPVLQWRPREGARAARAEVLTLPLAGGLEPGPVRVGRGRIDGRPVLFSIPAASPAVLPLDGSGGFVLETGTLWHVTAEGEAQPLVADRTGTFDREALAARQREGLVILYWAAVPVPSPDGRRVAFVTNREAVARGGPGQAVWLVDVASGEERPLASAAGESYRPAGWLDGEVVLTGGFPGIRAVDPETGTMRELGGGTLVGVADDGSALVAAEGLPDSARLRLLADGRWTELPDPPGGMLLAPQATFSPDAARVLVQATTPDGLTRRYGVWRRGAAVIDWIDAPVPIPSLDGWPQWLDDRTLLFTGSRRGAEAASWAVTVP